jgi:hypothetical protein
MPVTQEGKMGFNGYDLLALLMLVGMAVYCWRMAR